jgi:aldose 1-epimerase
MYQLKISPFGNFEKYTFINTLSGNQFSILPAFGATALDIIFHKTSVLDGYRTPEDLQENKWKKSGILFPFANRLKDGRYEWQGKTYQFPINEPATGNALHGLGIERPMRVGEVRTEENLASITCSYQDAGDHPAYPFPHTVFVTFRMEEPAHFTMEMRFQNDGDTAIPVGFGWHPYFQLSEKIDDVQLQLPLGEWIEFDERMLPTGKRNPYLEFSQLTPIQSVNIDDCFAMPTDQGKIFVTLQGERGTLRYWQETGLDKFNFLQLFIPESRQSLGVEPMTCITNGFNSGEGLITLEPGAIAVAHAGVYFDNY